MKKLLVVAFLGILFPSPLLAATFIPNNILSDHELTDYTSMGRDAIQQFLEAKKSFLAKLSTPDLNEVVMDAAHIIFNAATTARINPKYILALLQKEQSLIEHGPTNPSQSRLDWATGYAVCDGCSTDDPLPQKYKGFGKQVDGGAGANRFYLDNPGKFSFRVGVTSQVDGTSVTPENQATANQYIYTPHIHGNENLWKIWNRWWNRKYPNGVVLQAKDATEFWLIRDSMRHRFASKSIFASRYNPTEVIVVEPAELQNYDEGAAIKFPNFSLVKSERGMTFLLVDETKRPFLSDKIFRQFGYHPDEVLTATDDELNEYKNGRFISEADIYPLGAVVKSPVSGELYYVHNGEKAPVVSEAIVKNNFRKQKVLTISADELKSFKLVKALKFRDGSLVKAEGDTAVFVISDGMKRAIPSEATFLGMGWKWENVQTVDRLSIMIHPTGPKIELNQVN
ncbi:MAG: hypothetical protein HY437_00930 [Candidatus Magasanikbacteria bacterium]|nr:hypothetical protein [Candidatus Magasanikbacteria bacterium]